MTRKRKVPTKKGTETSSSGKTTTTTTSTVVSNKKNASKSAATNIEIIAETKSVGNKQPPVKKVVDKKNHGSKQQSLANNKISSNEQIKQHSQIRDCVLKSQSNEGFHNKYLKELQDFYKKIGHEEFMVEYKDMLKQLLSKNDGQNYATIGLQFLAKFATSFDDEGNTHPILVDTFKWLLRVVSGTSTVRFRICQFVNLLLNSLGPEAVLDDEICDNILKYMMDRLKDVSQIVRVQAINAMQRLQIPDDPNDMIVKIYQYHLNSDPSPMVRQATITSIGRNFHTIPFIIERFWDVDDSVRKHTYVQMSSYPVKSYKVGQRLTFLEQGLTDTSPAVRKVVTAVLIPQWLESYKHNYISFISSLKLDSQDSEMERFLKTAKMTLFEIFKNQSIDKLIEKLPLETEGDFSKCLLFDKISVESVLYWLALVEYLHQDNEKMMDLDLILPELSTMCNYIKRYLERISRQEMDKFKQMSHKYILMTLMQILITYDFSDEIGRNNLKSLVALLLTKFDIDDDRLIIELVKFLEILIPEPDERLQYIVDIVRNIIDLNSSQATMDLSNPVVQDLLDRDQNLKVKVSSIKLTILDLEEQEMVCVKQKNYVNAEKIKDRLSFYKEELSSLINPLLMSTASSSTTNISILKPKRKTNEEVIKCLQMVYHVVLSKGVKSLNPHMCTLYNDFIRRQIEVNQMVVRDWALKCGIAFSMLYEQLATDVYYELYMQFYRNQNTKIWITSISGIFDLIDYYGYEFFRPKTAAGTDETVDGVGSGGVSNETTNTTTTNSILSSTTDLNIKLKNKTSRQLYDKTKYLEATEEAAAQTKGGLVVDVMHLFCHFLDTCEESCIYVALLNGFCRLILRSRYCTVEIITKIILKFFNPSTSSEIQQTLGIFFETLITIKKQECLQQALLPTLMEVLEAPIDSPILEIKPDVIIKFVIKSTLPIYCRRNARIHDKIAISFLCIMNDNISHKELIRLLATELKTLELSDDTETKSEIQAGLDQLFNSSSSSSIDSKCLTILKQFKIKLNGGSEVVRFSSTRIVGNGANNSGSGGGGGNTSNASGGISLNNVAMSDNDDGDVDDDNEEGNLTADDLDTEPNIDDILSDIEGDDEQPTNKKQKEDSQKSDNDNKSSAGDKLSTSPPQTPSPTPPPSPVPPSPLNEQNNSNENKTSGKKTTALVSKTVISAATVDTANDQEKNNEKTTPQTNRRRAQNKKNTSPQSATTLQSPVNNRSNESVHLPVLTPSPAKPEETAATQVIVSSATATVFSTVVASTPLQPQPTTPSSSNRPTPTTYGLQNSTQVRYLRKSMNPRKLSSDDEIPTKVKVKTVAKKSLGNRKSQRRGSESQTENDDIVPGTPSPQRRTSNLRGTTFLRSYRTDTKNPKKNNRIIEMPNTEQKTGKRKNVIKSPEISDNAGTNISMATTTTTTTTKNANANRSTGDTDYQLNHIRKKFRTSNYNISENIDSDNDDERRRDEDSLILYRIPERLSRSSIRNLTATDTSPLTVKKTQNNNTTKQQQQQQQQPTTINPKTITRGLRKNLSNAILEKSKPSTTNSRRSLNDDNSSVSQKNSVTTVQSEPRRGRPRQSLVSKSPQPTPKSQPQKTRPTPPVSPPMTPPPSKHQQNNRKLSIEKIPSGGSAKENQQQQQKKQQNLSTNSTKNPNSSITTTTASATTTPPSTPKSTTKKILSPKSPTNNKRTVTTRKSQSSIESTIKTTTIAPPATTSSTLAGGKKLNNNVKKSKLIAPSYSTSSISSITSSTTSTLSNNDHYNQKQLTRQPRTRQAAIEEIKNNNVLTRNRVVKLPKSIWSNATTTIPSSSTTTTTTTTRTSLNKSTTANDHAQKTTTTTASTKITTTSATSVAAAAAGVSGVSQRPSRIARLKRKQ